MIRFKIVKGSHVLFALSVIVLLAVLLAVLLCMNSSEAVPTQNTNASAVAVVANADAQALKIHIVPDAEATPEAADAPWVLIYHTHTHEAYEQVESSPYVAVETWRTTDQTHSVVRVGEALAQSLREMGLNVIHDTTDHELNDINNSYVRSLETLEGYAQQFDLCIDLHRDAYSQGLRTRLDTQSGEAYAQVMLMIGQGNNYPENERPDYKSNLAFAQQIARSMNAEIPNICRNVTVKDGRYNQHIGGHAVLIEVGHNLNTLQEALAAVPCLANAIYDTVSHNL